VITVTKKAKEALWDIEYPEGTVLRLDPVNEHRPDEIQFRLAVGEPRGDDQVVEHEGAGLLRIARTLSEALNGSSIDLVETLEGPAIGLKLPSEAGPLPDGS
jgi:iron-sulfur cluster assembly protein